MNLSLQPPLNCIGVQILSSVPMCIPSLFDTFDSSSHTHTHHLCVPLFYTATEAQSYF